ncbi:MAG TPA: hypothetical protein VGR26_08825 [Acidimicrobiales bacterium]|nr:hypothetical protein [Acidimicrobiales bacterium]
MKRFVALGVIVGSFVVGGVSAHADVYNYGMCVKRGAVDPSSGVYGPRTFVSQSGQDNSGAATAAGASGGQSQFELVCTGQLP